MTRDDRLHLLLATADARRPALEGGLPADAVKKAKKPKGAPGDDDSPELDGPGVDPNLLPAQRWGVIAPKGLEGDAMLEAITPLLRLREAEQEAPIKRYRIDVDTRPPMDAKAAVRWKNDVYSAEDVPRAERPRYLLVLGDLDEITLDLQQALSNGSFVGRLCFTKPDGAPDLARYAAYAGKVATFAREPSAARQPEALFYVAADGTPAIEAGKAHLVTPCLDMASKGRERGTFPVSGIREISAQDGTAKGFLAGAAGDPPSVLLSVTHGLGAPEGGWKPGEARRQQGALSLGREILDAEAVARVPFLPGGMWFCFACFGAGTPARSAFDTWLSALAGPGAYEGLLDSVLASLPGTGESAFVAALPQAALANPRGPLAVIGHIDLAWSSTFTAEDDPGRSRASRIFTTLEMLASGKRAGVGLDTLMDAYRWTNHQLMTGYEQEADAAAAGRPSPIPEATRANLWMLRNDLRAYVLLGDPAVRLPLAGSAAAVRSVQEYTQYHSTLASSHEIVSPPPAAVEPSASPTVASKEAAVLALIRGDEAPRAIAARAGASLADLFAWFDAYRSGGRDRLER